MATTKRTTRKKTTKPLNKKASRKAAAGKTASKKAAKKKTAKKGTLQRSPAAKRTGTSRTPKAIGGADAARKPLMVEPGPPPGTVPPVEEPAPREQAVGVITHYYSHLAVALVQINTGTLRSGDSIHIKGHTTDLSQQVASMEYEHRHADEARPGQTVGIKVQDHVREHDIVFLVK